VYFQIDPACVPVPRKITAAEYEALVAKGSKGSEKVGPQARYDRLYTTLVARGAFGFENGLRERDFAEILAGPPPVGEDNPAMREARRAEYETVVEKELKALKGAVAICVGI